MIIDYVSTAVRWNYSCNVIAPVSSRGGGGGGVETRLALARLQLQSIFQLSDFLDFSHSSG